MAVIGITVSRVTSSQGQARHQLPSSYVDAVLQAGGVPVLLPLYEDEGVTGPLLDLLDGLLLSGGVDVDPRLFGREPEPGLGPVCPQRDRTEMYLTRAALSRGMPILAICRGIQVLNVSAGGTIIQDLHSSRIPGLLKHRQESPWWHESHSVRITPGSLLARLLEARKDEAVGVNSFHHQALDEVASAFDISARSPDGVIEGIEAVDSQGFAVGVQWHPEGMVERHRRQRGLFLGLVEAAKNWKGESRAKTQT